MPKREFSRLTERLLHRRGEEAFLRGASEAKRVQIQNATDFTDANGQSIFSKSVITLSKVDGPHARGDTVELVSGEEFRLDSLLKDNGYSQSWTVLGDNAGRDREFIRATARLLARLGEPAWLRYEYVATINVQIEHGVEFIDGGSTFDRSVITLDKVDGPFTRNDAIEVNNGENHFVLDELIADNGFSQQWSIVGKPRPDFYAENYAENYA